MKVVRQIKRNYGTNNPKAWSDICEATGEKHKWEVTSDTRCYTVYYCYACDSKTETDSSD